MAARRPIIKAIDWAKIAERVSEGQKAKFTAFRVKSDGYLRRVSANPEEPPKLDWAYYRKHVPIPGLVDTFQKQYESLQIPVPADTLSSQIDAQEKQVKDAVAQYKAESKERIEGYKAEVARISALLPFEQMTMEEFAEAFPEEALDPINNPTLWPHDPEDQIGYKPEQEKSAH